MANKLIPDQTNESSSPDDLLIRFIKEATWHGDLDAAERILQSAPDLAERSIFAAAILGRAELVQAFLSRDPAAATAVSLPYEANPLTCLCLSKYLRLRPELSEGFVETAKHLLDAGADPNGGFWTHGHFPEFETPLYGAAGVAHHARLTALLLERGADPNDEEAVYHSPESNDNDAMKLLVETGRLLPSNLTMMLVRKHDWHDFDGVKYLLEQGANPNGDSGRGWYPLHHALKRDNHLSLISLLFDHGADPFIESEGMNAIVRSSREGRSDVLRMMKERGFDIRLTGVNQLIQACALGDTSQANTIVRESPGLRQELLALGGTLMAKFTGTGNTTGTAQLLALGVDVNSPFVEGDGYYGVPAGSLPIHIAAWRGRDELVSLLISHGADVNATDANGQTPLLLAIKACVNSFWTESRSPASVAALLSAGASKKSVVLPTGYDLIDEILIDNGQ